MAVYVNNPNIIDVTDYFSSSDISIRPVIVFGLPTLDQTFYTCIEHYYRLNPCREEDSIGQNLSDIVSDNSPTNIYNGKDLF